MDDLSIGLKKTPPVSAFQRRIDHGLPNQWQPFQSALLNRIETFMHNWLLSCELRGAPNKVASVSVFAIGRR
jgi:hypothetical protein